MPYFSYFCKNKADKEKNMSLLVLGTVAFDDIKTQQGRAEKVIGGAATYISWAASFFTRDIKLCSIVGRDFPQSEIKAMEGRGIDTEGLEIVEDGLTFYWAGEYSTNFETRDTHKTDLNVLDDFDPVLPDSYKACDFVMLGNLTPDIQLSVLEQVESPRVVVLDTMNFWMDTAWDSLLDVIDRCQILTINDEEARQLSGEHSLAKAAEHILTMGPEYLIIKKGEHGALLFNQTGKVFFAPALPLTTVKDPTGAGDTFAGGMVGYLAESNDFSFENMKRSIIYASALASFCVEDFSLDRIKNVTQHDIARRIDKFIDIVKIDI